MNCLFYGMISTAIVPGYPALPLLVLSLLYYIFSPAHLFHKTTQSIRNIFRHLNLIKIHFLFVPILHWLHASPTDGQCQDNRYADK